MSTGAGNLVLGAVIWNISCGLRLQGMQGIGLLQPDQLFMSQGQSIGLKPALLLRLVLIAPSPSLFHTTAAR